MENTFFYFLLGWFVADVVIMIAMIAKAMRDR